MCAPQFSIVRYEHDTDKTFSLLKLTDLEDRPRGMLNWFAVHPTSMNNTNGLISSDNKGYASILFETGMEPGAFPGHVSYSISQIDKVHSIISFETKVDHYWVSE